MWRVFQPEAHQTCRCRLIPPHRAGLARLRTSQTLPISPPRCHLQQAPLPDSQEHPLTASWAGISRLLPGHPGVEPCPVWDEHPCTLYTRDLAQNSCRLLKVKPSSKFASLRRPKGSNRDPGATAGRGQSRGLLDAWTQGPGLAEMPPKAPVGFLGGWGPPRVPHGISEA